MTIGQVVRYYESGWRFGKLVELHPEASEPYAIIHHIVTGKQRVPIENVREAHDGK